MNKKYVQKLKDPKWQKKRLKILERDIWSCVVCGETEETLHVHHTAYFMGIDPWEYENHMLLTLCESCHIYEHNKGEKDVVSFINFFKDHGILYSDMVHAIELFHSPFFTRKKLLDKVQKYEADMLEMFEKLSSGHNEE